MLRNPPGRRGALRIPGLAKRQHPLLVPPPRSSAGAPPRVRDTRSRLASAHFSASLGRRFPRTIRSPIGSFARHPALLSRTMMMTVHRGRIFMVLRHFGLATALAATLALATPAHAVTEIQWWHAMTGGNNDVVVKLANDFNASQSDYKVVPSYKGGYADTMNAGIAAFRAGNAPHIMQVFEVGTATMMSATGAIKPVYQLMKDAGEPFDPKAYLPAITGYYSTAKGDMLSFPFNSSSMVMWINKDELKKAGVAEIPKTWPEVFAAAKKLKDTGHNTCGFSNAWASWAP